MKTKKKIDAIYVPIGLMVLGGLITLVVNVFNLGGDADVVPVKTHQCQCQCN
jgi:hypothetical protein